MITVPKAETTLKKHMEKEGLKAKDFTCGNDTITSAQVYSWLKTAKPWVVSEVGGKLVAHPPNRLVVLGGAIPKRAKKKTKKPARKGRAKRV